MSNSQHNNPLAGIAAAASAAATSAKKATPTQRIAELETKLAAVEPLLEQLQANSKIGPRLTEYVGDLRNEQIFFNRARYAVGCMAFICISGLIALLTLSIFHAQSPLLKAPPIAIATFVVGTVSGIAFLLSGFVKGVFRSTAERHADGFLPPALEKSVELLDKITGKP